VKVTARDVTKWLASKNLQKHPVDLNPTELEQVAKDLKVDKKDLMKLIATTHFETAAPAKPQVVNKLNGDIAGGAVVYNHGKDPYGFS